MTTTYSVYYSYSGTEVVHEAAPRVSTLSSARTMISHLQASSNDPRTTYWAAASRESFVR